MENQVEKKFPTALVSVAALLLAAIIAFGASLLPEHIFGLDTTKNKLYTFDKSTLDFIESLGTDIKIYMVVGNNAGDAAAEYFFERLCDSSKHLELEYKDSSDAEFLSRYGLTTDISEYTFIVESEKRYTVMGYTDLLKYSNSTLGFELASASEYAYYISMYQYYYQMYASQGASTTEIESVISSLMYETVPYFSGETEVMKACEYVSLGVIPQILFTEGNGEASSEKSAIGSTFGSKNNIKLSEHERITPQEVSCLVINAPTTDLSDSDTQKILDFLKIGGRLLVITNEENLEMKNLCKILSAYGLSSKGGIVYEGEDDKKTSVISALINSNNDALAPLEEAGMTPVITDANPITMFSPSDGALITSPLLTSSSESYVGDDAEKKVSSVIAASAEESIGKETIRIAWFTGAESFNGEALDDTAMQSNAYAIIYAVSWLNRAYDTSVPEISPKQYELGALQTSSSSGVVIGVLFVVIIPAAVATFGFINRYKRKKRTAM